MNAVNELSLIRLFCVLAAAMWLICGDVALCQRPSETRVPKEEKFVEAAGLVIPYLFVYNTCGEISSVPRGCPPIRVDEEYKYEILTIFDTDGSVWYRFSTNPRAKGYWFDSPHPSFKPLFPKSMPDMVILRLAKESPNWYEVEINDDTRETKFIPKNDPIWSRATWSDIFSMSVNVVVDQDKVKLRDAPNGKVIEEFADVEINKLVFRKLDGDWMFVDGANVERTRFVHGWVRWRDGRKILVGSELNDMKVPEK